MPPYTYNQEDISFNHCPYKKPSQPPETSLTPPASSQQGYPQKKVALAATYAPYIQGPEELFALRNGVFASNCFLLYLAAKTPTGLSGQTLVVVNSMMIA